MFSVGLTRLTLLAVLAIGGCSLSGWDEDKLSATGRVVLAETGEPLVGLGVSFCDAGGSYGCPAVDTDTTDADGAFSLAYDSNGGRSTTLVLDINSEPYDDRYTTKSEVLRRGADLALGTVEIRRREDVVL